MNFYYKELRLKQTVCLAIYIIYEVFLLILSVCMIHALATRDNGCDKYVGYLTLFILGSISYIFALMFNLYTSFRHQIKTWVMKGGWLLIIGGICFKVGFIIYSIVIYDRSYGDCYFPYTTQLILMIGSFIEMIFLVFMQNFWANNEKALKPINNN